MSNLWAIKWRSDNKLEYIIYYGGSLGCPRLFRTRIEARHYIEEKYGFIRDREDLQIEPHGWKMPIPVKVKIEVKEI